mgnify:CR=1 FL=1
MFVQLKKQDPLSFSSQRVRRLFRSIRDIQVVLPGFPAQQASAYLVVLSTGQSHQLLMGLYLHQDCRPVFFRPEASAVKGVTVEQQLQAGQEFAESMGFVVTDTDIDRLTPARFEAYWRALPICNAAGHSDGSVVPTGEVGAEITGQKMLIGDDPLATEQVQTRCRESLGRFLAAM